MSRSLILALLAVASPAFANGEFCDDIASLGWDTAPVENGGICQTVFKYGERGKDGSLSPVRNGVRDLWFDEQVFGLLNAKPDASHPASVGLDLGIVSLASAQNASRAELKIAQWTFVSAEQADGAYVLVVAAVTEGPEVSLKLEWRRSDSNPLSESDAESMGERLVASGAIPLGPTGASFRDIRLQWDKSTVSVTYTLPAGNKQDAKFELPGGAIWAPARMRAGLLGGTPLTTGSGARLTWSGSLYRVGRSK